MLKWIWSVGASNLLDLTWSKISSVSNTILYSFNDLNEDTYKWQANFRLAFGSSKILQKWDLFQIMKFRILSINMPLKEQMPFASEEQVRSDWCSWFLVLLQAVQQKIQTFALSPYYRPFRGRGRNVQAVCVSSLDGQHGALLGSRPNCLFHLELPLSLCDLCVAWSSGILPREVHPIDGMESQRTSSRITKHWDRFPHVAGYRSFGRQFSIAGLWNRLLAHATCLVLQTAK